MMKSLRLRVEGGSEAIVPAWKKQERGESPAGRGQLILARLETASRGQLILAAAGRFFMR